MTILTTIFWTLGLIALAMAVIAHLLNVTWIGGYGNYKRAYEEFTSSDFEMNEIIDRSIWKRTGGQVKTSKRNYIWCSEKDDFKVDRLGYSHNALYVWMDPLALYWHLRLRRWAHENLSNHEYIED